MITLTFVPEKETSNTIKFAEVHPDTEADQVGNLYVQKFALARLGNPTTLTVTIDGSK